MLTKEIIEGLLYITPHRDILLRCLTSMHILNETDRNWQPVQHTEFHFLDDFKEPYFLMIVDKQVHVYLIGDRTQNRSHHILNIEGFSTMLLNLPKSELINYIESQSKETEKLYLPELFNKRIIFFKPDYINNIIGDDDVYVFNNQAFEGPLFRKSKWSIGTNIYSIDQPEYKLTARKILQEIMRDIN